MQTTNNLGLKKPGENDFINVEDLNHNADILDSKVKEALDKTVEVVNELDSNETNKALSAAQGKELKRLIDEVPQVEIVDNMTTNNSQKALSAAQGVVIAEQLKKSGLKVANATYHNNTIAIEDFAPQENVPFLLNLSSVHRDSMQIDRNTKVAFGSRLLKITKFNDIEFLEATEIKQRQIICQKKENKVWIEVYSAELDNKIFELQQRVSECFQSAHEGKRKLADALVSKGQIVSSSASFQEMADKIRGIELGYKRGEKLPLGSVVFKDKEIRPRKSLSVSYPKPVLEEKYNFYCGAMNTAFSKDAIADDDEFLYCLSGNTYTNKESVRENMEDTEGTFLFLLKIRRQDMTLVGSTIIEHFEQPYSQRENDKKSKVRLRMIVCRKSYIYVFHSSSDNVTYVSKYTKQLTLQIKTRIAQGYVYRFFVDEPNGIVSICSDYGRRCMAFSLDRMSQIDSHISNEERIIESIYVDNGFLVLRDSSYNLKSYFYKNGKKVWEEKIPTDSNSYVLERVGNYVGFLGGVRYIRSERHNDIWFVDFRDGSFRDANSFFGIDKRLGNISTVKKIHLSRHEKRMIIRLGIDERGYSGQLTLLNSIKTSSELEITEGDVSLGRLPNEYSQEMYFTKNGDFVHVSRPQPGNYHPGLHVEVEAKYEYGIYLQ